VILKGANSKVIINVIYFVKSNKGILDCILFSYVFCDSLVASILTNTNGHNVSIVCCVFVIYWL